MGFKKVANNVGSGIANAGKGVGKGVVIVSSAIYSRTFLIAQILGLSFMTVGLVIIVIMAFQKISVFNMKALFKMITGVVFALVGVIMIGVSYGIRWKRRMIDRVSEIEAHLGLHYNKEAEAEEEVQEESREEKKD